MSKYAIILSAEPCPPPPSAPTDISICHFVWPLGNAEHKQARMEKHISHLLANYERIYPTNGRIDDTRIMRKRYSWGNGYIEFYPNGELLTLWAAGTYKMLGNNVVLIKWNHFSHVMKLDETLSNYISFRVGDLNVSCGSEKTHPLCFYGDSHGIMMFINLSVENTNLCDIGKTMFSLGRDTRINNFRPTDTDENSTVCFVYGEIDVRCHIGKQVALGADYYVVCTSLVDKYFMAIKQLVKKYKQIIIVGVPPPTDETDHRHTGAHEKPLPFVGTNAERVLYTNTLNASLKRACSEYGFKFFDPYDPYKRADGCLNYSLSDNCVHIGNVKHVHDEFMKIL
jgi:hypothetical protein